MSFEAAYLSSVLPRAAEVGERSPELKSHPQSEAPEQAAGDTAVPNPSKDQGFCSSFKDLELGFRGLPPDFALEGRDFVSRFPFCQAPHLKCNFVRPQREPTNMSASTLLVAIIALSSIEGVSSKEYIDT
jgi:hypothetical protein